MLQFFDRAHPFRRRFAFAVLTAFALWLSFCAVVGLWLPGKLQRAAAEWGRQHHYDVVIGKASINPFTWTVSLGDLRLADADKSALFTAQSLLIEAKPTNLLMGRWRLKRVELERPVVQLQRSQGAAWNWVAFVQAAKGESASRPERGHEPLPKIQIDHIGLAHGHIAVRDGNVAGASWQLDPLNLSVENLSTLPVEGGYQLSVALDDGARLIWHGKLELAPLSSSGDLELSGLTLARLWPFVPPAYRMAPPKGAVQAKAHYQFNDGDSADLSIAPFSVAMTGLDLAAPGGGSRVVLPMVKLDGGEFKLASHSLHVKSVTLQGGRVGAARSRDGVIDWLSTLPKAESTADGKAPTAAAAPGDHPASPWRVAVDQIAFTDWTFAFHDAGTVRPAEMSARLPDVGLSLHQEKSGLLLKDIHARLADVQITDAGGSTPVRLASIHLDPTTVNLSEHRVAPGNLVISGLELAPSRDRSGKIGLLDLFKPLKPKPDDDQPSPWQIDPAEIALSDSTITWRDDAAPTPVAVKVSELHAKAAIGKERAVTARVAGRVAGGNVGLDLQYSPTAPATVADIKVDRVPLQPFAPYALGGTKLNLSGGNASATLHASLSNKGAWQIAGQANVAQFAVTEPGQVSPLVGWRALDVLGLQAHGGDRLAVNIDRVRLDTAQLRLKLDQQRNLNLVQLFARPKSAGGKDVTQHVSAKTAQAAPQVNIRSVVVKTAEVDFADQSLDPGFATRMHDLSGMIQGISTDQIHHATVTLDGQVDTYGTAKVRGTLAPFALTDDSVLVLGFQNIPISSLDPYSESFAGWHVEDGRLSVDLRYALKNRQLDGQNHVVVQSIKLGGEVDKPGLKHLPLRLAVALLEDSDGRIDLDLPVSGRLDDPKFSYGRLIGQAIATVIEKVATAPFRALAKLLGHESFEAISFDAGQSAISPPEREKLQHLALQLGKRPKLQLQLAGTYDPAVDGHALARVRVDSDIYRAAAIPLEPGLPIGRPDFDDAATRNAVQKVYGQRIGRLQLVSKLLSTKDERARYLALRDEMIAAEQKKIDDATLRQLAAQRAETARGLLVAQAPELTGRIEIGAPVSLSADKGGVPLDIKLVAASTK